MTTAREQKTEPSRPGCRACRHAVGRDLSRQVTVGLTAVNAESRISIPLIDRCSQEA